MSTTTARRAELLANLAEQCPGVPVTDDARDLDKARLDTGIIYVHPAPRMEWPAQQVTRLTWTVYVLAKPGDARTAMGTVDPILDQLTASPLNLDNAEPGGYERPEPAPDLPGYAVSVTEDHLTY